MTITEDIFYNLIADGKIDEQFIVGCDEAELSFIEQQMNLVLPSEYKSFLRIAGKKAGLLCQGTDIFYPRVIELQEEAKQLLIEMGGNLLLPDNSIVICMHQGYEINYIQAGSDNPCVFQYYEGQINEGFSIISNTFSDFLIAAIEQHVKALGTLN